MQAASQGLMSAEIAKEKFAPGASLLEKQPATAAGDSAPARPPGYRNAWDDCGGKGASATERMGSIAASIKGFAKEVPFKRSAAQDCGSVDSEGLKPGPGTMVVYPNPAVMKIASDGLLTAELAKE